MKHIDYDVSVSLPKWYGGPRKLWPCVRVQRGYGGRLIFRGVDPSAETHSDSFTLADISRFNDQATWVAEAAIKAFAQPRPGVEPGLTEAENEQEAQT